MFKNNRLELKNAEIFSPASRGAASSKNGRIPQFLMIGIFSADVVEPRTGYPRARRCLASGNPNHPQHKILTARAGIQAPSLEKTYSAASVAEAAVAPAAFFNCAQVPAPTIPSTLRLLSRWNCLIASMVLPPIFPSIFPE